MQHHENKMVEEDLVVDEKCDELEEDEYNEDGCEEDYEYDVVMIMKRITIGYPKEGEILKDIPWRTQS